MPQPTVVKRLTEDYLNRRPMRTTSLIITVFGDVVSQHGGTIWLGSLVEALGLMGISERLVRTSVFRLVKEGWLEADRVGRRSFYRMTQFGTHEYERAARRIYAMDDKQWDGSWQLVIPMDIPEKTRDDFRRSLHWQGFRQIASGTYARPDGNSSTLLESLQEFEVGDRVMLMNAESAALSSGQTTRRLVHDCWKLDDVVKRYEEYLKRYRPLGRWLQKHKPEPDAAFIARTLLLHDYRRVLLQDTALPGALLPPSWPGAEARALTSSAYHALAGPSMQYITAKLEGGNGKLHKVAPDFDKRFP